MSSMSSNKEIISNNKYSVYEKDQFNSYQNFLYKRALFGMSMYTPAEVTIMHWDKRRRIEKVSKHAQKILNIWKQQIINIITNDMLRMIFTEKSGLVKEIINDCGNYTDPTFISIIDFKSLGVTKPMIVDKLIVEKVLPFNFYQLKQEDKPIPKKDVKQEKDLQSMSKT